MIGDEIKIDNKGENMKSVTVTLNFGKYKNCLWVSACPNFMKEHNDRFDLLEGEECKVGTMFFCNTYLEAQFVMALEEGIGLYSDEYSDDHHFVVCSKKSFNSIK